MSLNLIIQCAIKMINKCGFCVMTNMYSTLPWNNSVSTRSTKMITFNNSHASTTLINRTRNEYGYDCMRIDLTRILKAFCLSRSASTMIESLIIVVSVSYF